MTVPKRFGVLRLVGMLLKVFAWIILVLSVIFAIAIGLAGPTLNLGDATNVVSPQFAGLIANGGIFAGIIGLILGLIYFLMLYAVGESLQLQVAMEENTRLTAALLLRMHQDSQIEPEPDYGTGGFATEPTYGG